MLQYCLGFIGGFSFTLALGYLSQRYTNKKPTPTDSGEWTDTNCVVNGHYFRIGKTVLLNFNPIVKH